MKPRHGKSFSNNIGSAVLTVGHSTRTIEELLRLLRAHDVTLVADVRTIPRSRHNPQFNRKALARSFKTAGLSYLSMPGLGGLRHARPDSPNVGWRNKSFRGYADYMQTPEFERSVEELIALAKHDRVALMCAEAVPWRCHRSLIADALLARGIPAEHIMSATRRTLHSLTSFARFQGTRVVYPPAEHDRQAAPATDTKTKHEMEMPMKHEFKVGEHVAWNSEAGRVSGTIKKKIVSPTRFKAYIARASKEQPQYLIQSDKTDHLAMHKGAALRRIKKATTQRANKRLADSRRN